MTDLAFAETPNSRSINASSIDQTTFNPKKEEAALRQPQALLDEIKTLDKESAEIIDTLMELI